MYTSGAKEGSAVAFCDVDDIQGKALQNSVHLIYSLKIINLTIIIDCYDYTLIWLLSFLLS